MTENIILTIPAAVLSFPAICEPQEHSKFQDGRPRYGVSFTLQNPEHIEKLEMHNVYSRKGRYHTSGIFKPIVTEVNGAYNILRRAYDLADLRNLPRNRLFVGIEAQLMLRLYNYDTPDRRGVGLSLAELTIDATELEHNAIITGTR